jgi:TfoX/Sxy family transcriptional regulator of competence genes
MASSKEYLDFVLEQLSGLDDISHRAMMGEYIIYYKEKVIGGIYDDRFLIKPAKSALNLMPNCPLEIPYPGAKKMILADIDNRDLLNKVIPLIYEEF